MAVRLTFKAEFSVSSTMADEKDLGNGEYQVRTDAMNEGGAWRTRVADAETDLEIKLDNIANVKFIFLRLTPVVETDPAPVITFKLDAIGNTAVTLASPSDRKEGMLMLTTDSLSALYVTNASGYAVDLTVSVAGD